MDLQQAINAANDGGTVKVPKGTHLAQLVIEKSVTLEGEGPQKSIIDAEFKGACVLVNGRSAKVKLVGLTLKNGSSPEGGCIAFRVGEALEVDDCVLEGGQAKLYGGGGARLAGRSATLVRIRVTKCGGQQGGGILADDECQVQLTACVLTGNTATHGGALRIKEAAKVTLLHCTVADNKAQGQGAQGDEVVITGTMTRTPELQVINSIIVPRAPNAPPIGTFGQYQGKVTVRHSLFTPGAKGQVPEGPGNVFAPAEFMPQGQHRQTLSPTSPAAGAADASATPPGLLDVRGNPLDKGGKSDIGAYAA